MASRVRAGLWCLAATAAVACSTKEPAPADVAHDHAHEHTGTVAQALTAGQLESPSGSSSLGAKVLSLTFDDGPGPDTSALSTYLKDRGIKATFFVNGQRMMPTKAPLPAGSYTPIGENAYKALLAQLVADGHLVSNHTTTHRNVGSLSAQQVLEELKQTDDLIAPYVPANRFLFRAPFGAWNATAWNNLKDTAMNKYVGPIYWGAGGFDTGYPNRAADWACWQGALRYANGTLVSLTEDGTPVTTGYATTKQCGDAYVAEIDAFTKGVVLMHDPYGWARGSTFEMVKYIVPILEAKNYTFVRLDQVPAIAAQLPCDASCATCSGPEPSQCTTCDGGKFLDAGSCKTCSTCQPGQYVAAACAANADTQCTACDPACATCTAGGNASCQSCSTGYWLNGTTCLTCTACAAGTFASAACTASADTVCTACGAGTWSAGNATACTACGSCDDGDACTTDVCDPTKGCTHAKIDGCPTPDAGTSSSSSSSSSSSGGGSSSSSGGSTSSGGASGTVPPSADGGTIDLGVNLDPVDSRESGCSAAPGRAALPDAGPALAALAALVLAKRRRRAA